MFQQKTSKDSKLKTLITYVKQGWPGEKRLMPECIKKYNEIASELTVVDELVLENDKPVVPKVSDVKSNSL